MKHLNRTTVPRPTSGPTEDGGGGAITFADVYPDILAAHILTRLDGPTLAATSCASAQLHSLSAQDHHLWAAACLSAWPSTAAIPRLLSTFPGGPRSFFSLSYPLLLPNPAAAATSPPPPELISAVDIYHKGAAIFSKVQETETLSAWFLCSPFRIDALDPKNFISTTIRHPDDGSSCTQLGAEMTLSWVLIDPVSRRAANLSCHKPVAVQRHWLSGEVLLRFGTVVSGCRNKKRRDDLVHCSILVTGGASESGDMQIREVSLKVEDMDGMQLTGKESLAVFHRALDGKRGKKKTREEEGKRRYREFLEMKRERRERKLKAEGTLDALCVAFGVSISVAFLGLFLLG
ncbi:probable F-box protein At2g36090 [Diospyros lotus]|uniref:probable F-box protein At2g36090 n=1 Tax=Diospyros lotus TaxID=55363 RepID=UPI00224CD6F2|nr:probable F-box protein At2g36090 [Diospyros lotus]